MTAFSSGDAPFYTLDISRLLSRASARVPTGIDRVELEYARYLSQQIPDRLEFAAVHPLRLFGLLPFDKVQSFLEAIGTLWDSGVEDGGLAARLGRALLHGILRPRRRNPITEYAARGRRSVYLLVSHHHLTCPDLVAKAIRRRNSLFIPLVHDLIPLEFPEYARDREPPRHLRRIETVVRYADAVIVPSDATKDSLLPYLVQAGREDVPIWSVPLGVHLRATAASNSTVSSSHPALQRSHPYFVCLGTIEGRKNHMLLLNLWRRLATSYGSATPHLIIIGKRGWENEQVIDMLERSPKLNGTVEEYNTLPDTIVASLLRNAKGLLFPSFTEGFGLPLAEALAMGTPVVCSDIPVFHEIGRKAAIYLDPLDGPAWAAAVEKLAGLSQGTPPLAPDLSLEEGQLLTWSQSISRVLSHIDTLLKKPLKP